MQLTLEELRYLRTVLKVTPSYTIARGQQIDHPTVNHKQLTERIEDNIRRLTM